MLPKLTLASICLFLNLVTSVPDAWAQKVPYPAAKHGGNYMFNYYLPPAPSTTPWAPAWSPDGKWIAVAMNGSIWRVDPAAGIATELTHSPKYHSSPAFSPDGEWLLYTADDDGKTIQLEILNLQSGQAHSLTQDDHLYLDPVFSPDGTQLAYVSTQPRGYFNVFVRPIHQGGWSGPAAALTEDRSFGRDRLYFGPWDMHTQPAWLPDGKELLMVTNRDVPLGSGDVWRIPISPRGIEGGRKIFSEQTLYRTRPDVSPDGKRFLYSSTAGAADQYSHLYALPVDGGAPYKLTFGEHDDFHPRWSPDGEQIAFISNRPQKPGAAGLPELWLLETHGGKLTRVELRELRWKKPMGKVRVQVRDAATGRLTPARIYGLASDGKFYAPRDSYARIGELGEHLFHTGGQFTLAVPGGKITLEAVKGFEYWPAQQSFEVRHGESVQVTLTVKPMVNFAARGWINGSTHVHMNYGGNLRNTLQNLMFMSKAEDQEVVNELVANKDNRILDWQHFVPGGGEHPVSKRDPDTLLIVGEEYRPPFYGHVFFIGLRDHLISPFTTGYEGTGIESLYPSNTDMFRKARTQGAAVGYVHAFSGEADPLGTNLGIGKGFPVDAALGTIHAMEWSTPSRAALRVWHHALNNDLPIAAVGGEDSITSLHRTKLVGSLRTYAYVGKPDQTAAGVRRNSRLTAESWIHAIKQGRTFFTSGPLLDFHVNQRGPGESLKLAASGEEVLFNGRVWSIVPLTRVLIYRNGQVWRQVPLSADKRSASLQEKVGVDESSWYSMTAEGAVASHPIDALYPQAATSAIRVYVGTQKIRNRESAEYFVRWIDKLQTMAEAWPGWRSQKERDHVFSQFREARQVYQRLAQEQRK
ncbi:MAG: CehA/McbA family metallohydrolase [Acidobacteria bacterium]|nr:CehA/McbA family metallohydrolase [Acidobacteriota bacterium]